MIRSLARGARNALCLFKMRAGVRATEERPEIPQSNVQGDGSKRTAPSCASQVFGEFSRTRCNHGKTPRTQTIGRWAGSYHGNLPRGRQMAKDSGNSEWASMLARDTGRKLSCRQIKLTLCCAFSVRPITLSEGTNLLEPLLEVQRSVSGSHVR